MYLENIYQILPMNLLITSMFLFISLISIMSSKFFEFSMTKNLKNLKIKKISKMSLFLSFDPKSNMSIPFKEMNWIIMIMSLTFVFLSLFVFPSRNKMIFKNLFKEMSQQLSIALKTQNDSTKVIFVSIFFFLFFSNFIGLVPNSFTSSSHITMNLMISFPLWMGFFIFGWLTYSKKMFSHLVPSGTPMPLISFMVLIELISTSIRPFTLSIRLMANMVSGHLLLTLMGNTMTLKNPFMVLILSITQLTLLSLEMAVSIIQAYVFCILLTLYSDDSDFSK